MSEQKNDGGGAFPWVESHPQMGSRVEPGMTLRDYFAAKAMQAFVGNTDHFTASLIEAKKRNLGHDDALSIGAYQIADAMLAARER